MDEFVFLLPRPDWQPDEQSSFCNRCHTYFSLFLRKHHCRHCGLVYCHLCCSRKTPLRQLGYLEQVKVCESCFELAYLISYVLNYESKTTQLHGARGLYEILVKHDEDQMKTLIQNGGFEAFIFLSQRSLSPDIHLLSMMALRYLLENDDLVAFISEKKSAQRYEHTFSILVKSITAILEGYMLVPEVKEEEFGARCIRRIIFNAVLTGSRLVFLLAPYPHLNELILKSKWLYLFLDALEQAVDDCGFTLPPGPNLDSELQVSASSVFQKSFYSRAFSTQTLLKTRSTNNSTASDDLWIDALELQVVASGTICMLSSLASKEESVRFNSFEVKTRIANLISRYPNPSEPESFHFQPSVSIALDNLNHTLKILDANSF
ncbi:hypothetical protein DSO57_1017282 [Entomophthora muscae]|uniref:Uncharacterized protein n=1 Tax=Entomophthora muscae TaxID=34485 RepID=A0ACC2UPF4_9FUNG|nr:hypothetical protein DSO57_1017282 [Entomophthora muscae]